MFFSGFYIDPLYLAVFFITLVISIAAQMFMSSTLKKWNQVRNGSDLSGTEAGYAIVNRTGLGGGQPVSVTTLETPELKKLAELRDKGLVTEQEYLTKKGQIKAPQVGDTTVNTSEIEFQHISGNLTDHYDPRTNTVRLSDGVANRHSVAAMAIVAHDGSTYARLRFNELESASAIRPKLLISTEDTIADTNMRSPSSYPSGRFLRL